VFSDSCDLIDLFRVIPGLYRKFIQPINEERGKRYINVYNVHSFCCFINYILNWPWLVSMNDYSILFNELNPHLELALDDLYSQRIEPLIGK